MGLPERSVVSVVAIVAAVAAIFWQTSWSMVTTWQGSNTYSHGFLIAPAFVWLVWSRRRQLAQLRVQPSWWVLPCLAACGVLWVFGQWTSLALPAQLAVVAMMPTAVAIILGTAWLRALLFPFVFLFFAVPFGESLVPTMMDWTADFTVAALRLSGVPVYRDGLHFAIPSGNWSVVDSCSGIRYLFACLAVSSLYGWMIYRSNGRRLLFIGVVLVIAVAANWVRAYAIVMLGHLSNNQIAVGVDHLVYGALFFAVIMLLVFALGAMWREDAPASAKGDAAPNPAVAQPPAAGARGQMAAAATAVAAALAGLSIAPESRQSPGGPMLAASEIRAGAGWSPTSGPLTSWRPTLSNPVAVVAQSFAKNGHQVGVHLGVFHRPRPESKLTSSLNRLLEPDGLNLQWRLVRQGTAAVRLDQTVDVRTAVLVGNEARLLAWQWYWVDGAVTTSPTRAVLLQVLARLQGRSEVSAWVTVHTRDGDDPSVAPRVLQAFVADMAGSIGLALAPAPMGALIAAPQ